MQNSSNDANYASLTMPQRRAILESKLCRAAFQHGWIPSSAPVALRQSMNVHDAALLDRRFPHLPAETEREQQQAHLTLTQNPKYFALVNAPTPSQQGDAPLASISSTQQTLVLPTTASGHYDRASAPSGAGPMPSSTAPPDLNDPAAAEYFGVDIVMLARNAGRLTHNNIGGAYPPGLIVPLQDPAPVPPPVEGAPAAQPPPTPMDLFQTALGADALVDMAQNYAPPVHPGPAAFPHAFQHAFSENALARFPFFVDLDLTTCREPSEYDRQTALLICRIVQLAARRYFITCPSSLWRKTGAMYVTMSTPYCDKSPPAAPNLRTPPPATGTPSSHCTDRRTLEQMIQSLCASSGVEMPADASTPAANRSGSAASSSTAAPSTSTQRAAPAALLQKLGSFLSSSMSRDAAMPPSSTQQPSSTQSGQMYPPPPPSAQTTVPESGSQHADLIARFFKAHGLVHKLTPQIHLASLLHDLKTARASASAAAAGASATPASAHPYRMGVHAYFSALVVTVTDAYNILDLAVDMLVQYISLNQEICDHSLLPLRPFACQCQPAPQLTGSLLTEYYRAFWLKTLDRGVYGDPNILTSDGGLRHPPHLRMPYQHRGRVKCTECGGVDNVRCHVCIGARQVLSGPARIYELAYVLTGEGVPTTPHAVMQHLCASLDSVLRSMDAAELPDADRDRILMPQPGAHRRANLPGRASPTETWGLFHTEDNLVASERRSNLVRLLNKLSQSDYTTVQEVIRDGWSPAFLEAQVKAAKLLATHLSPLVVQSNKDADIHSPLQVDLRLLKAVSYQWSNPATNHFSHTPKVLIHKDCLRLPRRLPLLHVGSLLQAERTASSESKATRECTSRSDVLYYAMLDQFLNKPEHVMRWILTRTSIRITPLHAERAMALFARCDYDSPLAFIGTTAYVKMDAARQRLFGAYSEYYRLLHARRVREVGFSSLPAAGASRRRAATGAPHDDVSYYLLDSAILNAVQVAINQISISCGTHGARTAVWSSITVTSVELAPNALINVGAMPSVTTVSSSSTPGRRNSAKKSGARASSQTRPLSTSAGGALLGAPGTLCDTRSTIEQGLPGRLSVKRRAEYDASVYAQYLHQQQQTLVGLRPSHSMPAISAANKRRKLREPEHLSQDDVLPLFSDVARANLLDTDNMFENPATMQSPQTSAARLFSTSSSLNKHRSYTASRASASLALSQRVTASQRHGAGDSSIDGTQEMSGFGDECAMDGFGGGQQTVRNGSNLTHRGSNSQSSGNGFRMEISNESDAPVRRTDMHHDWMTTSSELTQTWYDNPLHKSDSLIAPPVIARELKATALPRQWIVQVASLGVPHFCAHVQRTHHSASIYFRLMPDGIYQCCYSSKQRPDGADPCCRRPPIRVLHWPSDCIALVCRLFGRSGQLEDPSVVQSVAAMPVSDSPAMPDCNMLMSARSNTSAYHTRNRQLERNILVHVRRNHPEAHPSLTQGVVKTRTLTTPIQGSASGAM